MKNYTVALMGNPNVGKSTLFNKLTHKKQHTGNWAGKTVEKAEGTYKTKDAKYKIVDLPGIYSLDFKSEDEKIARDFLLNEKYDTVITVCDAVKLPSNLTLILQVIEITHSNILCINMMDEAYRKGISIDTKGLENALGIKVVTCCARKDISQVIQALKNIEEIKKEEKPLPKKAEIINRFIFYSKKDINSTDKKIDKIVCGKYTAVPVMLIFLLFILWLTISGANVPSYYLSVFLTFIGDKLNELFIFLKANDFLRGILIDGAYGVLAQVVSVMLPPMAIFFPLFALLEESGFLPRIALNADKPFKNAGSSGKQALTMCMGLGCNAVGVTGCRIIPSEKQRLIATVTNSFIPCNGRFPTLILLIGMMLCRTSSLLNALILSLLIVLSVVITFMVTKLLSKIMTGENLTLSIEQPSYKKPQILKTLADSFVHKTLHILLRAVAVAAPAGAILWLLTNIHIGNNNLLIILSDFLEPIGRLLCMDGVILLAFILGFPANEIVLPIAAMIYLNTFSLSGGDFTQIFIQSGWDTFTLLSVMLFSLFHWPCATTLLTIKKETGSIKYTALSVILPTLIGALLCLLVSLVKLVINAI